MLAEGKKEQINDQGQLSIFKDELEFSRHRKRRTRIKETTFLKTWRWENMEGGEVEKLVR